MRRSSIKKAVQAASTTSVNPSPAHLLRTASSKATSTELERIDSLFYAYVNGASGLIDPEGIESLCADMEVDHTDVRILMLAWLADEWRRGRKTLRADTIGKLKKALPELEKEVKRPSNFVDFYAYAFRYCSSEEKQKSIDIENISELLDLVLGNPFQAQVDNFTEYLKAQNDYKVINMDQWMVFFRFCCEISFPDFSNYDPELAWPLVLDNFVDWMQAKQG